MTYDIATGETTNINSFEDALAYGADLILDASMVTPAGSIGNAAKTMLSSRWSLKVVNSPGTRLVWDSKYNSYRIPGVEAVNTSVTRSFNVAKQTVGNINIPVYSLYGGASRINGWSWSPINPKLMPKNFYRKYAGLPNANWSTNYIKGSTQIKDVTLFRKALPIPSDGVPGGLPELLINPNKINYWSYMERPGIFNTYWGF